MNRNRSAPFILSLSGGILILLGGIVSLPWTLGEFEPALDPLADLREMLGEEEFRSFQIRYTVAGISSGIAVIMISFLLRMRAQESNRWGIMIIVLSGMSVLGMGGFIFGMALGIIGGAIAIMRSRSVEIPREETKKPEVVRIGPEEKVQENLNVLYKCSWCDVEFKNDDELKQHIIRIHMNR